MTLLSKSSYLINFFCRILSKEDVDNLAIYTGRNYNGTLTFTLTTVAEENDGDRTFTTSEVFSVDFLADPDNPGSNDAPGQPTLDVGTIADGDNVGDEDTAIVLNINATEAGGPGQDPTNPIVTVTISDIPEGFIVNGATVNPTDPNNLEWSADAEDFLAGRVTITPRPNFSGEFNITVEAVATSFLSTSNGDPQILTGFVDPVADGVSISVGPTSGFEDQNVTFGATFSFTDMDSSEDFDGEFFYISFESNAFVTGYSIVNATDLDRVLDSFDLLGYYRIPISEASSFLIELTQNWHGIVFGDIRVPIIEVSDDNDGDNFILSGR